VVNLIAKCDDNIVENPCCGSDSSVIDDSCISKEIRYRARNCRGEVKHDGQSMGPNDFDIPADYIYNSLEVFLPALRTQGVCDVRRLERIVFSIGMA